MGRIRLLAAVLAAAALAGCGAVGSDSSGDFEGESRLVAQTVEDLEEAVTDENYKRICDDILAPSLAQKLGGQGGQTGCQKKMENVIDDSDNAFLTVKRVVVNRADPTKATAVVEQTDGNAKKNTAVQLEKLQRAWRIAAIGGPAVPAAG